MASEEEDCQAVVKAELSVCKAQDVREDTELIMKPYANWEEYLMPAPLSIAILGNLIFISAGQGDFSINKNPPPRGFRYLRYPESFRACLCQVSNEGWHAFHEAHVNMDKIRLLTASIPGRMKLLVETLFQEVEVVNAVLPGQLSSMKSIVTKCTTLAYNVKDKYKSVIFLIQELLEASTNAKTAHTRELEEVQTALRQAKIREEMATKHMKLAEEYYNKMQKQTEDTFKRYKKAMDDVPSGWEAIAMTIVENLGNAFAGLVNGFANILQGKSRTSTGNGPSGGYETLQSPLPAMRICRFSSMLLTHASGLKDRVVKQGGINLQNVYDKRTGEVKTNWTKQGFLDVKNDIEKEENCLPKEKALNICQTGIYVCGQLEQMAKSARIGKEEESAIIKNIKELCQQAASFDSYSKGILNAPAFTPKPPHVAHYQKESTGGSVGVRNAHLKVQQSREMYKTIQEEYQKSFENFKEGNEKLVEILCLMEQCKVKEIDFEAALKMLTKGLEAMGQVQQQWEKMIRFFGMISNIIDTHLSQRINDCLEFVSDVQQIKGYSSKSFVTDTIYNQMLSASAVVHLVHMIAETYTEVSEKHVMDQVSSLGRLLSLDCTHPKFNDEWNALSKRCDEARKGIYSMVIEKKVQFDRNIEARMKTIEREMKAVLPPISAAEKKMIEEAVDEGRKELTAWEKAQFI
ncbi:uncharacterized protein LOC129328815 [Eublepharis macularius]|uniref:Uncharacterized protein LOC129328815 n=1 Tax=Eublepharis macularius TaxID=481883 RepID=A0AA97KWY1_EUBMA|nr:uncharacterized protein LOC129328815 [Eublepharis macularius]XP_054834079.1 uncharacterized protein LOC129328815 [Eublepharis macularius]